MRRNKQGKCGCQRIGACSDSSNPVPHPGEVLMERGVLGLRVVAQGQGAAPGDGFAGRVPRWYRDVARDREVCMCVSLPSLLMKPPAFIQSGGSTLVT